MDWNRWVGNFLFQFGATLFALVIFKILCG